MYFENVVIGKPIVDPSLLLSKDEHDWNSVEKEKTFYTEERFLPRLLVDLEIYPSISEVRRNKPELIKQLNSLEFIDGIKVSKKRKLWIVVGE